MPKEIEILRAKIDKLLEENKNLKTQLILEYSKNLLLENEISSRNARNETFYKENENEYS